MLIGASDPLKKRLGWLAYAISAARHLGDRPMRVTVSADGARRRRMRANTLIVGNVGWLRGGLPLLPDARPDDGMLDAVVLIARGLHVEHHVPPGVILLPGINPSAGLVVSDRNHVAFAQPRRGVFLPLLGEPVHPAQFKRVISAVSHGRVTTLPASVGCWHAPGPWVSRPRSLVRSW